MLPLSLSVALLLSAAQVGGEAPAAAPAAAAAPTPLFSTNDPFAFTLGADWGPIKRDRTEVEEKKERFPAKLSWSGPNGKQELAVELETRGHFRLRRNICAFPPLRVHFPDEGLAGTPFEGQKKLKLVTHCKGSESHDPVVLREYLVYRAYNTLTDLSFRARLAQITYTDLDGDDAEQRVGFLLEPDRLLAARNGRKPVEEPTVSYDTVDRDALALVELFEFAIGNVDYSAFAARPGNACCHNVVQLRGATSNVPVPYDFDNSGVVNAPYAEVSGGLPIKNVRQRFYRGLCKPEEELQRALAKLLEKREAILALYRAEPLLEGKQRDEAIAYWEEFFAIASDPAKVKAQIADKCRPLQ
jgi:hypothetical protein